MFGQAGGLLALESVGDVAKNFHLYYETGIPNGDFYLMSSTTRSLATFDICGVVVESRLPPVTAERFLQ